MSFDPLLPLVVVLAGAAFTVAQAVVRVRRGARRTAVARSTAACALAVLAAAGPVAGRTPREVARSDADVLFVVDTTGSMGALDHGDGRPRLEGVRADLAAFVDHFPGAHFALVRFDSVAQIEVPWTTDSAAVHTAIELLRQERTLYATGSDPGLAIAQVERLLPRRGGGDDRYTVIVYVSDGERTVEVDPRGPGPLEGFRRVSQLVDGGIVLGYGTPQGGRMRVFAGLTGQNTPYIYDPATGDDAISRIDEESLEQIADALAVPLAVRSDDGGVAALAADVADRAGAALAREGESPRHVTWVPALGLLLVAGWQFVASAAELLATRRMLAGPAHERRGRRIRTGREEPDEPPSRRRSAA